MPFGPLDAPASKIALEGRSMQYTFDCTIAHLKIFDHNQVTRIDHPVSKSAAELHNYTMMCRKADSQT